MNSFIQWFGESSNSSFVSFIVSVAAVIISVIAIFKTKKTDKKLLEIEETREKDRLKLANKAMLQAHLKKTSKGHQLVIKNIGPVAARDVSVCIEGKPILKHKAIPQNQDEIKLIGPDSEVSYIVAISMGNAPPFHVEITWIDCSRDPGHYHSTLTL